MWGQTTSQGAKGPAGRPHLELVQVGTWQLCSHIGLEEDPMPESRWKLGGVDGRLAVHHLQTDLINSVEAPLYAYIRISTVEFTPTTLFL
jgi:hypothetical protein